jgi:hypothetical protein
MQHFNSSQHCLFGLLDVRAAADINNLQNTRAAARGRQGRRSCMFGWLMTDGWCWFVLREEYCWLVAGGWFVLREEYCWLVAGGWFVLREKYCWLVADKPSEQAEGRHASQSPPRRPQLPQPVAWTVGEETGRSLAQSAASRASPQRLRGGDDGLGRLNGEMARVGEKEKGTATYVCHVVTGHRFRHVWTCRETQTTIKDLSDTLWEFVDRGDVTAQV